MNQLECLELQSFLREKIQDVGLHKKAVSIALGIALSRLVPLPTLAVDSAENHFLLTGKAIASDLIASFNEAMVVDVGLVSETTRTYWLIRYGNAYPETSVAMIAAGQFGFLTKLAGAGRYLNPETHAFCEDNSELMVVLINRITRTLVPSEGI